MISLCDLYRSLSGLYGDGMHDFKPFTPIARLNFRNRTDLFGIKPADRLHHIFCIGATGCGKSRLLINMCLDDIYKGVGVCVVDPHADAVSEILAKIPENRKQDVVLFDATNMTALPAFNPLYNVPSEQRQLVASEMVNTFKKLFLDAWGSKLEYLLRFTLITLLQYEKATLLDIQRLLTDKEFRAEVLETINDAYILHFWKNEYDLYTNSAQATAILPILNKVGVLLSNDRLRGIFGQQVGISFEQCMNERKIVLVNLSKGEIGEDVCTLLGSFITIAIQHAAMRRATTPIEQRVRFYLYIDEAQNFVSGSFAGMLPQVRKFGLGLFLCTQHLAQLEPETRSAILGNFGSLISFRLGLEDAKLMAQQFYPDFKYDDFISLPKYHIYLKLLIDGTQSKGFSAISLLSFDLSFE